MALFLALGMTAGPAGAQDWFYTPIYGLESGFRWPGYAPGELLVQFRPSSRPDERERAVRDGRAELLETVTPDGLVRIRLAPSESVLEGAARWSRRGDVEYAAPNLDVRGFFTPNDSLIANSDQAWFLRNVGAFDAWDVVTADPSVVLAIVDSGVAFEDHEIPDYERPLLWPGTTRYLQSPELPGPFLPGYDFVNSDAHANDDLGHGTAVATVAAGMANNIAGSAGIAFGVTILPVKVLNYRNDGQIDDIVQGIRFAADQRADIINLSLGTAPFGILRLFFPENDIASFLKPLRDAVHYARSRGSIVVAAAGNFGVGEVSPPAAFGGVISVGASGLDDNRSSFSSYGAGLAFLAPGGDFEDLNSDRFFDGIMHLGMKPNRSEGSRAKPDSFGVFGDFSIGTSLSAPLVAGAIALLMSQGLRDQGSIEQTLRASAVTPVGNPNAYSEEYGFGVIKIDRAVRNLVPAHGLNHVRADAARLQSRLVSRNPARDGAAISFRLPRNGRVRVRVFDARGALVRTLLDRDLPAGTRILRWDGRRDDGAPAASGLYFMRLETDQGSAGHKVALLR